MAARSPASAGRRGAARAGRTGGAASRSRRWLACLRNRRRLGGRLGGRSLRHRRGRRRPGAHLAGAPRGRLGRPARAARGLAERVENGAVSRGRRHRCGVERRTLLAPGASRPPVGQRRLCDANRRRRRDLAESHRSDDRDRQSKHRKDEHGRKDLSFAKVSLDGAQEPHGVTAPLAPVAPVGPIGPACSYTTALTLAFVLLGGDGSSETEWIVNSRPSASSVVPSTFARSSTSLRKFWRLP